MMGHSKNGDGLQRRSVLLLLLVTVVLCSGCSVVRPIGLIYTNMKLPLTRNLHDTPVPVMEPPSGRVLEIREPVSGLGIYAKVDSNAIGEIAKKHGMEKLYFADQQVFSVLGIWSSNRTILYGE